VTHRLFREPHRFDFFQAVRLLESLAARRARQQREARDRQQRRIPRAPVGHDHHPSQEAIRFRALDSLGFPPGCIDSLDAKEPGEGDPPPPEMVVSFLGLTGPQGVLPDHYTRFVIRTARVDDTLRDFLDLFHHRIISLFYRAWAKYHFFVGYEQARQAPDRGEDDAFSRSLYCLVGLGSGKLRNRLELDDEALLHFAGHFSNRRPTALSLQAMLRDYFGLPMKVLEFQGCWLRLDEADQTRIACRKRPTNAHNQLGGSALLGKRVWDIQSKFRIRVGPLGISDFRRLRPGAMMFRALCQFVRLYAGPEWDFDVQLVLKAADVPGCVLGTPTDASRLGYNTWLHGRPIERDADDAVHRDRGVPSRSAIG
jgi:type VI secretion system protein ImpH